MNSINLDSRALNNFTSLSDGNLEQVDGGIFPIVIVGGITITKGGAIAAGLVAAGLGSGFYFGSR